MTVNGRPLHEPYARPSTFNGQFRVPEGAYLLLDDNRDASDDSRLWANPYVPRDQLTGRLLPQGQRRGGWMWAEAALEGRR